MSDPPAPPAPAVVTVEPEASVTLIEPGTAPAPAVDVAATGGTAGARAVADIADVLLRAYRSAVTGSPAGCHLPVSLLAAIGEVESGSLVGRPLDRQHRTSVLGPVLDGNGFAAVADTDNGRWDGNTRWDRAVGPMQFIPGTWRAFGADGDGDGVANPQDVEDAAAGAADYLCFGGRDLTDPAALRRAILSYNHSDAYLALVMTYVQRFAALGLDDPGVIGLPTHLSLVATALAEKAGPERPHAKAHRERSGAARSPATVPGTPSAKKKVAAAAAPTEAATAAASPAATAPSGDPAPVASADRSPAVSADPPPATSASTPDAPPATAPADGPSAPAAPAAPAAEEQTPSVEPTPTSDPSACPTAPVDGPTAPDPSAPSATPTASPSADPPSVAASGDPVGDPCSPCPDGVDPAPEQPCQPVAAATEPAPSSAP